MPEARRLLEAFGVDPSMRVVLFVADWTSSRRKGFELLDSALGALPNAPRHGARVARTRRCAQAAVETYHTSTWEASRRTG